MNIAVTALPPHYSMANIGTTLVLLPLHRMVFYNGKVLCEVGNVYIRMYIYIHIIQINLVNYIIKHVTVLPINPWMYIQKFALFINNDNSW
jgi:hypothetical protein